MSVKKTRTLYDILSVESDASTEEIKKAYRNKAKELHPDTGANEDDSFIELSKAYAILTDPEKREKYDKTGYVDDSHHDSKEVAYEILQIWFGSLLTGGVELLKTDLLGKLKEKLQSDIDNCHNVIKQYDARYDVLKEVKGKLECKRRFDVLGKRLEEEIEACSFQLQQSRYQISINESAIIILDDYIYHYEG